MLKKSAFSTLIWFLVAMTFVGAVGIPKGFNYSISLIFICTIGYFIVNFKAVRSIGNRDDKKLFFSFLAFAVSVIFINSLHDFKIKHLDYPIRFILSLPVLLLLLKIKSRKEFIWYGSMLGAILAFLLALYQRFELGIARANGKEVAIMFGDTAMMLGLLSFAATLYFLSRKQFFWVCVSVLAGASGVGASILSGTRGGWIAFPLLALFLLWNGRGLFSRKAIFRISIGVVLSVALVVYFPQTGVQHRINQAVSNITQYSNDSNKNTSVGLRFDMWKAAWYMFEQSPIIGVGTDGAYKAKQMYIEDGLVDPAILQFNHAHNEYMTSLSLRGAIGLFFLMIVYLVPLRLCLKKMREYEHDWRVKSYAIAGAIVPMSYMDFALTQAMFNHNIGVMMYAFPIVFLWAAVRWAEREVNNEPEVSSLQH
ncbi:O-antigen ligase family protein [Marinomonas sp.]|uniref:O-antigen ligase family protein n=1 Tax=Marinomonas sp. TaxID=1904862 RepID=UPI003F996A00